MGPWPEAIVGDGVKSRSDRGPSTEEKLSTMIVGAHRRVHAGVLRCTGVLGYDSSLARPWGPSPAPDPVRGRDAADWPRQLWATRPRRRWALVAAQMRRSVGVSADVVERRSGVSSAGGIPWLGLVLWAVACGGLFVSLVLRPPYHWPQADLAASVSTGLAGELAPGEPPVTVGRH